MSEGEAAATVPANPPPFCLELALPLEDAARLPRVKSLGALRTGRARSTTYRIIWHDTPDRSLTRRGVALAERHGQWQLGLLRPSASAPFWYPGTPAPVLAESGTIEALGEDAADRAIPAAAFEGRQSTIPLLVDGTPLTLTLLHGELRVVTQARPIARLTFNGEARAVCTLARALAGELALAIPTQSLAAEALAMSQGLPAPPRRVGTPTLTAHLSVGDAFARVVAHLSDVLFYWGSRIAAGAQEPEAVHQMRVALRRLRSAMTVFRRAVASPEADEARHELKILGARLGPARDWDVFCTGTGSRVHRAFPEDRAVEKLLAAAERRRLESYAVLRACLASPEYRRLAISLVELAATRIWEDPGDSEQEARLRADLDTFATRVLDRRLRTMLADAENLLDLPLDALHVVRLHGKRLRYAAEFFAPLAPGRDARRYLRRLTSLQERLGHLNDGAVAAALLAELGQANVERAFAIGVVRGFVGAEAGHSRDRLERSWQKLCRQKPFWT